MFITHAQMLCAECGFLKHIHVHEPVLVLLLRVNGADQRRDRMQFVVDEDEYGVFWVQFHVLAYDEQELREGQLKRHYEFVFLERMDGLQLLAAFHHHRNAVRMLLQNDGSLQFSFIKWHIFTVLAQRNICHNMQ